MIDDVEIREGYYWPKTDISCWKYMKRFPELPIKINQFIKNKNTVVHAGANCGFYAKQYAEIYDVVYAFEPDWLNFYCLNLNVGKPNVVKIQSCLGNKNSLVNLAIKEKNRGKNFVKGAGIYPTFKIDSLNLNTCDLIHLDTEGYEYYALLGAEETIKKFKPVIVLEMWDQLNDRFEENINRQTHNFLTNLNYQHVDTLDEADKVYIAQ